MMGVLMYSKIVDLVLSFIPLSLTEAKYAFLGFVIFIIFDQIISNSRGNKYLPLLATSFICLIIKVCDAVFLNQHGYYVLLSLGSMLLIPLVVTFVCKKRAS